LSIGVPLALLALVLALDDFAFRDPARVTIRGYSGEAMEPFVTRDGRYLLFNNLNDPPSQTDMHWAERVDDLIFDYRGTLTGANSPALDAVPTVDAAGTIFFVTTRSYEQTLQSIYRGTFSHGAVQGAAPVAALRGAVFGEIHFDVEVSADGSTLYFAEGLFTGGQVPLYADLHTAVRDPSGVFTRVENGALAAVNSDALEYAACISANHVELFFTRIVDGLPAIFRSTRSGVSAPWGPPERVTAITGFAEAPTIAPGGTSLYYHALRDGHMVIERVTRPRSFGPSLRRRAVGRQ
jgi:hypothetical protein